MATFLIPIEKMLLLGQSLRPGSLLLVMHGIPLDLAGLWFTGTQLYGSLNLSKGTPSYHGWSYKIGFPLKTSFSDGASSLLCHVFTVRKTSKIGTIYSLNARAHPESG